MQMVLKVEDSFVDEFKSIIEKFKDKVKIEKDKNLEIDPYFYERQKQLQKDIEDIDSGKAEMISHKELWNNIYKHIEKLSQ